jgi:hypothetical protein
LNRKTFIASNPPAMRIRAAKFGTDEAGNFIEFSPWNTGKTTAQVISTMTADYIEESPDLPKPVFNIPELVGKRIVAGKLLSVKHRCTEITPANITQGTIIFRGAIAVADEDNRFIPMEFHMRLNPGTNRFSHAED